STASCTTWRSRTSTSSSAARTPSPDPALMSPGMMCPRATCRRCTEQPAMVANCTVRLSELSGESGAASIEINIRWYMVVSGLLRGLDRDRGFDGGTAQRPVRGGHDQGEQGSDDREDGQHPEDRVGAEARAEEQAADHRAADPAEP